MVLNNIFKVKIKSKQAKSKSQKYLDSLRRASSGNTLDTGVEQLENLNDGEYERMSDTGGMEEERVPDDENALQLRRLVSGFSNMESYERNKNPTIKAMSSDLLDFGNGSYMEVQLTRLDFLEKNTEWVSVPSMFHTS
jgi:hypothetical protein